MKKYIVILLLFTSIQGYSQLSKKHFIPPLTSAESGNANPEDQYIYISTPSTLDISYTIIPVGQPTTSYISGTVSNTDPDEISIGTGDGQLFVPSGSTSTVSNNKGYIIEADAPVYVSVRMNAGSGAQAGALVSKGQSALGNTFRIGSYTNENPQNNYLNFASVMATQDNTKITFSDLEAGLIIQNYTGTTPITITLNEGESYIIATNSSYSITNKDGLIGTLINSDKPIVVNCGSTNGSFSNGTGRDYGIDQIVGLSKVGTEYILVKGDGENAWENILIVAHTDNTFISINGNTSIATINAGDHYLIEGNQYNANGNMYVKTSEPVFTYQGVGATTSEANQGMFFVPPLSCETRGNLDNIANIGDIGFTSYTGGISIVTKTGSTVTINNTPISSFSSSGPNSVTGKTDYVTYKVTGLSGNISVESSDELYCAYFNYNGSATSGSFYSGFLSAPEINFAAKFSSLGNCIPNVTLSAANPQSFDSFEWWFDDGSGSGFIKSDINTPDLTPTTPGKYKLIGILNCTGISLESAEVPVSICPDDTDNDGIIDNLDIDNDNDGILNCTESAGDVIIDLTNTNTPLFIFQDNTSTAALANSATFTQNNSSGSTSNSFSGTSDGNFTSIVQSDTDAENEYSIAFSEDITINLSEDITTNHTITDGEYFIAGITPSNKNITLVDPDNRLLVDSNFDGVFETGITQISGSEIHFKINPTPNGATPYAFYANQVNGFSFIHRLANTTNASTYTGNLSLNCYKLDSDGDGIKDALDYDSDNDGIPDFVESYAPNNTILSGVDADENGLDDSYDINATPVDNDSDGIPDYLDLDADNDGIYDIIESGSGLLDTDFDGIIDNVIVNIGVNGWDDNAETTPDSNTIGYTLNNIDSDTTYSYIDLDSDDDTCNDVIEAGFSESNTSPGQLQGTGVDTSSGVVIGNTDGYTTPGISYLIDGTITITTQPIDTEVCENGSTIITIASSPAHSIQWQVSIDNGINWTDITNNAIYNGSNATDLSLTNTPLTYTGYLYRVFLSRTDNSCGIYSEEIQLTVLPLPTITTNVTLVQCDDDIDGFSSFNLTEANDNISSNAINETFTYYTTQAAAIAGDNTSIDYISTSTAYTNTTVSSDIVWANIESSFGCSTVSQIQLNVSTTQIPNTYQSSFNICDDFLDSNGNNNTNNNDRDGIATFDFSSTTNDVLNFFPATAQPNLSIHYYRNETDALAEINEITDISNYRNIGYPNTQQIYIRVENSLSNDCLGLGNHITLTVNPLPEFSIDDSLITCTSDPTFTTLLDPIEDDPSEIFTYQWAWTSLDNTIISEVLPETTPTLTVSTPGTYHVTLTKTDGTSCSRTRDIFVNASETASITYDDITIKDFSENNTVTINDTNNNLGLGSYEYALEDGVSTPQYQDSPIFEDVFAGIYTLYVRDKNGCGTIEIKISVVGYQKFFTPNSDSYNDFWNIKGVDNQFQPNSNVLIFNRYGSLLTQISPNSKGWDGTINGKPMPATDYWFTVSLEDGRIFKGHFTLKR